MRGSAAPIDLIASTPDNGALWCIRAPPRRGDRLPAQERPRPPSRQPQTRPDRRLGDAPCARNRSSRSNRVPGCRDRDVPSEVLAGGADRGVGIRPVSTARMRLGRLVPVSQRVPVPRSSAPSDGLGTRVACSLAGTSRQQQSSLQTTTRVPASMMQPHSAQAMFTCTRLGGCQGWAVAVWRKCVPRLRPPRSEPCRIPFLVNLQPAPHRTLRRGAGGNTSLVACQASQLRADEYRVEGPNRIGPATE